MPEAAAKNETLFTFRLYSDGHTDRKYVDFLRVLALRRYQFRIMSKYVSSVAMNMFVYVQDYEG